MANQYNSIQFKIEDSVFEALDISAGGTSIVVPEEQQSQYPKGRIFEDCTLRFNKKNFTIKNARIAGAWERKDNDGELLPEIKLGIAFEDLPPDVEEALFKHINTEARLEEVRKKMAQKASK
jgi:c-di-GMP-binding flagellar brake protein YcgR